MDKKCAIFGHRKIDKEDKVFLDSSTHELFENMINEGDKTFLFGSNSEFDDLCYGTITNLQNKYTGVKRIGYLCASELAFTKDEQTRYTRFLAKQKVKGKEYRVYEDIQQFAFENRNLYIERNKKMIDDADICVFYYKEDTAINNQGTKTNSGTKIALEYAKSKNKIIVIINKY